MFYVSLAALIAVTATPSAGQTTIPFTYVDNRIVVECKIDGQGPFTMILDTGSPSIAVTPETAAKLAIAVRDAASVTGAITLAGTEPAIPPSATTTSFEGVLPEIHAVIDGIAGSLLVDSGDRSSLTLFGPFAKRNGFFGRYPSTVNIVTGYGLGGPVYADVFTLPSLDVFAAHLTNVVWPSKYFTTPDTFVPPGS
jgi:hypothetical protein